MNRHLWTWLLIPFAVGCRRQRMLLPQRRPMRERRRLAPVAFVVFILATSAAQAHPFHVSFAEAQWNPKTMALEVAIRVDANDLEAELRRRSGKRITLEEKSAEPFVRSYVQDAFRVQTVGEKPAPQTWVGYEVDVSVAWLYVEIPLPHGPDRLKITNELLLQVPNQVNTVHVRKGEESATLTLTASRTSGDVAWTSSSEGVVADDVERLQAANAAIARGDADAALQELAPLLDEDPQENASAESARRTAARLLHRRGEEHFRAGRIEKSVADFDREVELSPQSEPGHWQRGISYYYAGRYEKGVEQFELHQTVNPQDVENAVWHFLCAMRAPGGSVATARAKLIPIQRDPRVPMKEVHDLFAGTATPEDVLAAAEKDGRALAKFYADLYVGLHFEAMGNPEESLRHVTGAAANPASRSHYMGDVARTHVMLRERERDRKK